MATPHSSTKTATTGREELATILFRAARQDGPVRLFQPRDAQLRETSPGLFPSSRGSHGRIITEMVGTMFNEVLSRPRMVKLTSFGVETLLRNTPQTDRPQLIAESSPLYREALLAAWKKFSTRGESALISTTVKDNYGQWLQAITETASKQINANTGNNNDSALDRFREQLAREIADSWHQAESQEAKNRLAQILRICGAQTIGDPEQEVQFSGIEHISQSPMFKGDRARILHPGWLFPREPAPYLLVKAEVEPI